MQARDHLSGTSLFGAKLLFRKHNATTSKLRSWDRLSRVHDSAGFAIRNLLILIEILRRQPETRAGPKNRITSPPGALCSAAPGQYVYRPLTVAGAVSFQWPL